MAQPPDNSTHNAVHGDVGFVLQAHDVCVHRAEPAPTPRELPCAVRGFTGRTEQLRQLDALLAPGSRTLVISALAGTAGVGKTALALHWAHRVKSRFPDGQLFWNLRGFDPVEPPAEPGLVLEGFLHALNVPTAGIPADLEVRQRMYRTRLAGKRMLVVLDNAATAEQVRPLLPGSDTCLVVVTSRNSLPGLVSHEGAHRIAVDVLSREEAVGLLAAALGDEVPARILDQLAELCGRLPLALRIIAERLAASTASIIDLVEELEDERSRLCALSPEDDSNAVRAVFSWSYLALSAEDARTFRLLGLHPGPDISAAAADALVGGPARQSLQRLVSAHLLEAQGKRYRFHDLVRLYAAERVRDDDEQLSALTRLVAWYVHTVADSQRVADPHYRRITPDPAPPGVTPLTFTTNEEVEAWFAQEHTTLVAVTRCANERGLDVPAWQLPALLTRHYMDNKRWKEWRSATYAGLDAVRRLGDTNGEAEILNSLGILYAQLGEPDESFACHARALALRRTLGDRHGECVSLNNICFPHKQAGRLEKAYEGLLEALAITREISYAGWLPTVLMNLAQTCGERGSWHEALAWCDERFALGAPRGRGELVVRGEIYRGLGRVREAIQCLEAAWDIARDDAEPVSEAYTLIYLGRAYRDAGRAEESISVLQRAVDICHEHNAKRFLTISLQDLAEAKRMSRP